MESPRASREEARRRRAFEHLAETPASGSESFRLGEWLVRPSLNRLERAGEGARTVEPRVMRLLVELASAGGEAISRAELISTVWSDAVVNDEAVTRAVSVLRGALDDDAKNPRYIETVSKGGYRLLVQPVVPRGSARRAVPYLVAAAGLVSLLLIGLAVIRVQEPGSAPSDQRFGPPPAPLSSLPGNEIDPAVSPDGKQVAFAWNGGEGSNYDIYIQTLGEASPTRVSASEATEFAPTWSPDGSRVVFARGAGSRTQIVELPAGGGPERLLYTTGASWVYGMSSAPDGSVLAFTDRRSPAEPDHIALLDLVSGRSRTLTDPPSTAGGDRFPSFAPDGRTLAFVRASVGGTGAIHVVSTRDRSPARRLVENGHSIHGLGWSPDGRSVIFSSERGGEPRLWQVAVEGGRPRRVLPDSGDVGALSLGGPAILVYESWDRDRNLWRLELPGGARKLVVSSTRDETTPSLSPAGDRLAFASSRTGRWQIWTSRADGSRPEPLTSLDSDYVRNPRWSRDGGFLVFEAWADGQADLYTVAPGQVARLLVAGPAMEIAPALSRDGSWVYFSSDRSGDWQVWRIAVNGGPPQRVTEQGGLTAFEGPDGRLYFAKPGVDGLWRHGAGGAEERVLDVGWSGEWGTWAPWDGGVYLMDRGIEPTATLLQWRFEGPPVAVGRIANVARFGLAASPDGASIYWAQVDSNQVDLMMVAPFDPRPPATLPGR